MTEEIAENTHAAGVTEDFRRSLTHERPRPQGEAPTERPLLQAENPVALGHPWVRCIRSAVVDRDRNVVTITFEGGTELVLTGTFLTDLERVDTLEEAR